MTNLWLKIRLLLFGVLAVLLTILIVANWDKRVDLYLFTEVRGARLLTVLLVDSIGSIFCWWIIKTVFKTLRQIQQLSNRQRTARLERQVADMAAKASMLQTKTATPTTSGTAGTPGAG